MKIGLYVCRFSWPGGTAAIAPTLAAIAKHAEEAGFASLWVMDHLFQHTYLGPPEMQMLEAYTTLGYLAANTRRLRLGTLVTGVTYRYPGLLAKAVTTLDVLWGERATLGIGAAWFEREHTGLGISFPPTSERFERIRRDSSDRAADVVRESKTLQRTLLSACRDAVFATSTPATSPAYIDRWEWRDEDIAVGGTLCRRM